MHDAQCNLQVAWCNASNLVECGSELPHCWNSPRIGRNAGAGALATALASSTIRTPSTCHAMEVVTRLFFPGSAMPLGICSSGKAHLLSAGAAFCLGGVPQFARMGDHRKTVHYQTGLRASFFASGESPMTARPIPRTMLASAIAASLALCAGSTMANTSVAHAATASAITHVDANGADVLADQRSRYILGLKDAPLALATRPGNRPFPRLANQRLDVNSPEALDYISALRSSQNRFLESASTLLGRVLQPVRPEMQFQHAFNGMVVELTDAEVAVLSTLPEVATIEPEMELPLHTDTSLNVIGAPTVWSGLNVPGNLATRGEGVVVGIIDSGVNIGSSAFAPVSPLDGYVFQNPLGSGNFLGWCNPSHPNHVPARDICNDKLIGGWDFTDAAVTGNTTVFDAPGFEDENGHGTHTASTAAGNTRQGTFNGISRDVSGVAPRANIVIYDTCHTAGTQGSCFNTATLAAINQIAADGIIDVVNYSIGGGLSPWSEANSQGFLALQNAGVYVAASAGNSGPGPSTLGHLEPWVSTTGGTTHARIFGFNFSLTGPGTPPANTMNITVRPGGAPIAAVSLSGPLIVSPNFANGATDGCAAYPADTFRRPAIPGGTQGIAVLQLDGATSACASGVRRTNAVNAGAAGVIFVDDTPLSLGASGTSYSMLLATWNQVAAHVATDPANATATIPTPLIAGPGVPDIMYASSSRGPNAFSILKPDLVAPGLEVLASYTRWTAAAPAPFGGSVNVANNNVLNAISGTSMASPHNAGAAALLRALNRSWTPVQIRSALMTTAVTAITKETGLAPTDAFDIGAGRIDLTRAAKAGLVLNETGANFTAANPGTGGDPSQLNLPSFQNLNCVGTCTFPRTVQSTRTAPVTWTTSVTGFASGVASVSPPSFTVSNAGTAPITLSVDALQLTPGQVAFGQVVLTPSNPAIPVATMPVAVRSGPPDIDVQPTSIAVSVAVDATTSAPVQIRNVGNPTINWSVDEVGTGNVTQLNQINAGTFGQSINFFSGQTPTAGGIYGSDDHTPEDSGALRSITVDGFMTGTPATALNALATQVTFKVYSDAAGIPAGNPEAGAAGEIYSCARTPAGPNSGGLSFLIADGSDFRLDTVAAAAAGCPAPPALTAGTRYWISVFPTIPGNTGARRWIWSRSSNSVGLEAKSISPLSLLGVPSTWTTLAAVAPPALNAYTMVVTTDVQCGAPWFDLATTSASLGLAGITNTTLDVNATGLTPGNQRRFLCVDSNGSDPDEPRIVVPVNLTVTAEAIFTDGFE
jgi:subtilisin family serine protease